MTPTIDILANAKRLIERAGWCQGNARSDGAVCVLEALMEASGRYYYEATASFAMMIAPAWSIPEWNDKKGRTVEDVLAALDRAMELVCP